MAHSHYAAITRSLVTAKQLISLVLFCFFFLFFPCFLLRLPCLFPLASPYKSLLLPFTLFSSKSFCFTLIGFSLHYSSLYFNATPLGNVPCSFSKNRAASRQLPLKLLKGAGVFWTGSLSMHQKSWRYPLPS